MKVNIYFTSILLFLVSFAFAQAPDTLWTRTYGGSENDMGYSVQKTLDGGYIIVGETWSYGAGESDVWFIKTDSLGDTLWTKTFGGASRDGGLSVDLTIDGGYIIVGSTFSYGTGNGDVYLIKTDSIGNVLWTRTYGDSTWDVGYSVLQTTDDGYIITGLTERVNVNVWLIKTDVNGDTLWTKTYGDSAYARGHSIEQTSDGGYIITGLKDSFSGSSWDVYLIKTDANGDTLWTKTYGGIYPEIGYSVQGTGDGGYIITGGIDLYMMYGPVYLIKTDASGDTLWTKTPGGFSVWYSVQETADSNYIIVGAEGDMIETDIWLLKIDSSGNIIWTQTYGDILIDQGYSIQVTTDGGYIITGYTYSFGAGSADVWLLKIAPDTCVVEEEKFIPIKETNFGATIISGLLLLPEGKNCKVFDITGRIVVPNQIKPGIYFIQIDGKIKRKVVKVR
jgi:hypothetical protein